MFAKYFQGLWVNFQKNHIFCFLGPNGSGKTTIIDCLTGITPSLGVMVMFNFHVHRYKFSTMNLEEST